MNDNENEKPDSIGQPAKDNDSGCESGEELIKRLEDVERELKTAQEVAEEMAQVVKKMLSCTSEAFPSDTANASNTVNIAERLDRVDGDEPESAGHLLEQALDDEEMLVTEDDEQLEYALQSAEDINLEMEEAITENAVPAKPVVEESTGETEDISEEVPGDTEAVEEIVEDVVKEESAKESAKEPEEEGSAEGAAVVEESAVEEVAEEVSEEPAEPAEDAGEEPVEGTTEEGSVEGSEVVEESAVEEVAEEVSEEPAEDAEDAEDAEEESVEAEVTEAVEVTEHVEEMSVEDQAECVEEVAEAESAEETEEPVEDVAESIGQAAEAETIAESTGKEPTEEAVSHVDHLAESVDDGVDGPVRSAEAVAEDVDPGVDAELTDNSAHNEMSIQNQFVSAIETIQAQQQAQQHALDQVNIRIDHAFEEVKKQAGRQFAISTTHIALPASSFQQKRRQYQLRGLF